MVKLPPQVALASGPIDVTVKIRPFGYLTIDQGERSAMPLAVHAAKLTAGKHRLKVTCDACELQGKALEVNVEAGKDNTFNLPAPLKPSLVSFDGFPDDAMARIGNELRSIADSKAPPFHITTPPRAVA
ncbi:MAG: hypothetical protein IPJ65_32660 [Archangiaceae bacterium]|nr:hypothetical protein [Archangiaceae bacterium]